jgi:hypothetical protein
MTDFRTPLDAVIAYNLNDITSAMAEDLAARIAAKSLAARVGYSSQSCSTYVEVDEFCVRISDHEARSYNRTGDFNISVNPHRYQDAAELVWVQPVYEYSVWADSAWDEDGEPTGEGDITYVRTKNQDEGEDSELVGYLIDPAAIDAAVERAAAWLTARASTEDFDA